MNARSPSPSRQMRQSIASSLADGCTRCTPYVTSNCRRALPKHAPKGKQKAVGQEKPQLQKEQQHNIHSGFNKRTREFVMAFVCKRASHSAAHDRILRHVEAVAGDAVLHALQNPSAVIRSTHTHAHAHTCTRTHMHTHTHAHTNVAANMQSEQK